MPASPRLPESPKDLYPAYSAPLPPPGGTLDIDDPWYIARDGDTRAKAQIRLNGQTITIKGPRQMGKSSLLMRVLAEAMEAGKRCALLDLQLLDRATRQNQEMCFRRFAEWVAEELEIPERAAQSWDPDTPHPMNCSRFVEKRILARIAAPVTLAIDEADIIFSTSFCADFFAMLRKWHNDRSNPMKPAWKKLDLVLVTSTEPFMFINRVEQSPFNVGEVLALEDFSPAQARELNARHRRPLSGGDLDRLIALLGGHPYLIRKALYSVTGADPAYSREEMFRRASEDNGPFRDHLRHYLLRLQEMPDLLQSLAAIAAGLGCADEGQYYRLQSAGLAKREQGKVVPRCKLYGDYFRERIHTRA
jgi:AAA-like domain